MIRYKNLHKYRLLPKIAYFRNAGQFKFILRSANTEQGFMPFHLYFFVHLKMIKNIPNNLFILVKQINEM